MAFEELQLAFESQLEGLVTGTAHEKYEKYGKEKIEDFTDTKRAKALGLYGISPDARLIYKGLRKEIKEFKGEDGREPNYLLLINDLLKKRMFFLDSECGGDIDEDLMDASEHIIKLMKIYKDLYRRFVDLAQEKRCLDKIGIKRKALSPEVVKNIRKYTKNQIFRMEYDLGA
jgi:hypothetical protein